jgi:hypothetical protein
MRYKFDDCDAIIDTEENDRIVYDDINARSGGIIEDLMNENESFSREQFDTPILPAFRHPRSVTSFPAERLPFVIIFAPTLTIGCAARRKRSISISKPF